MLIGNVGKDPEVRYLENNPSAQPGTNPKVAQFTLATTERFRDRSGEVRENTEWHNIVAWRGLADLAEKYIRKGSQIYVEGQIRTRSWTDQAGAKQYRTEIIANAILLLGRKSDNPANQQAAQPAQPQGYQQPAYQAPAGFQSQAQPVTPRSRRLPCRPSLRLLIFRETMAREMTCRSSPALICSSADRHH